MNERELVKKARAGDFKAFTALINAYSSKLYALARRLSGNDQDAEDIVQDTFLKAIDKIDQFRGEASFGTWLYSIALNEGKSLLVKQKRTDLKPIEEYLPSNTAQEMHDGSHLKLFDWKDPHEVLEDGELRKVLDEAVNELPYEFRVAFLLRYYEELPIKEIAGILGESVAATKSRVLRAKLALRDRLSRVFEERYG